MFTSFLSFDSAVFQWVHDIFHPGASSFVDGFFSLITLLGDGGLFWIALGLAFLIPNKTRKLGVVMLGALLLDVIFTNAIFKPLFSRPRPFNLDIADWAQQYKIWFPNGPLIEKPTSGSFPSGHTAISFAGALGWCFGSRKKWVNKARWVSYIGIAAAVLVGLSRIYLGVHYATDVLGGAVVGTACAGLAVLVFRFIEPIIDKLNVPISRFVEKHLPKAFH